MLGPLILQMKGKNVKGQEHIPRWILELELFVYLLGDRVSDSQR